MTSHLRLLILLPALLFWSGCLTHTLTFDEERYRVWVSPLTAKKNILKEIKVDDARFVLDVATVPYEFRDDWRGRWGLRFPTEDPPPVPTPMSW